jgi:uncharacterized protein (TIGR02145 family)
MKYMLKIAGLFLLFFSIILVNSCKKDKPTPPVVTTTGITEISYTSATSGGNVTDEGGSQIASRGICWSTYEKPTTSDKITIEAGSSGAYSSKLTNLNSNTLYHVRAYATNVAGTAYGNELTFTTSQIAVPVLTTTAITSITSTTAVSGGNITDDKGSSVTVRGICWGTVTNPTTADNKTTDGTDKGSFVSNLSGLSGNTTFYVRAYATNSAGTAYGNEIIFTTNPDVPTLSTSIVSPITTDFASGGGSVISDGGAIVTSRGVCWNTSQNPTTDNNKTIDGSGLGVFASSLTGLTANTTYYLRAYAVNSVGTGYGNMISFTTGTIVADIDGNDYSTVILGTQTWMTENLKVLHYTNGDPIPNVPDNTQWSNLTSGAYCWYSNDGTQYKDIYGAIYNYYTVADVRNICPANWRIPNQSDWITLQSYLGGNSIAGGKLKEAGNTYWYAPNDGATDESKFTAMPGGDRAPNGGFEMVRQMAEFWTSTEASTTAAYSYFLGFEAGGLYNNPFDKKYGLSVRCIKN